MKTPKQALEENKKAFVNVLLKELSNSLTGFVGLPLKVSLSCTPELVKLYEKDLMDEVRKYDWDLKITENFSKYEWEGDIYFTTEVVLTPILK